MSSSVADVPRACRPTAIASTAAVVALGADLGEAREVAYAGVEKIDLPGSHHRSDIALKALRGEITV